MLLKFLLAAAGAEAALFQRVQECLIDSEYAPSPLPPVLADSQYIPPLDLNAHFKDLLVASTPFRGGSEITYAGYKGPWLERVWINTFCCNRTVEEFGGLVPLFVQWTDMSSFSSDLWYFSPVFQRFYRKLRRDVLYVTVSQNDVGITNIRPLFFPGAASFWNVFVMSAGGFGHMPLPLLMKELPVQPAPHRFPYHASFVGTIHNWSKTRLYMMKKMGRRGVHYSGPRWQEVMRRTLLNLAPRGFGRSSFHLYEIIQMGLLPVYIYNDHEWLPYRGSPAHVGEFGYSVHIDDFYMWLKNIGPVDFHGRRTKMLQFRESHYTFAGVMQQIDAFFKGGGDLSCSRHPLIASIQADPSFHTAH